MAPEGADGLEVEVPGVAAGVRRLAAEEVEAFARNEVMGPGRVLPLVAVTTDARSGRPWVDPEEIARLLGPRAVVVLLETGEPTWALSAALPPRLDAYGGAVRVWHPGVTADSDPRDHPLLFAYSPRDVPLVRSRVLEAVLGAPPSKEEVLDARVESIDGGTIRVRAGGRPGVLLVAGIPREVLAKVLRIGQRIPVRVMGPGLPGEFNFTARGLLRTAWERLAEEVRKGDVVRGLVREVEPRRVVVELLPGAAGHVPAAEIDWERFEDARSLWKTGDRVSVVVLELDAGRRCCLLSLKRAFGKDPRPGIALVPGGLTFPPDGDGSPASPPEVEEAAESGEEGEEEALRLELRGALEDRDRLVRRGAELTSQLAEARKALRAEEDRGAHFRKRLSGELDPASSERAFLLSVRLAYARLVEEADRGRFPLRPLKVGREFLARLRDLQGVTVEKVVEVCAQAASGKAKEIPGREVHPLRGGESAAGFLVRPSDGAKAWRCSLQDGTPGARRLHWWSVPGPKGGAVEFASVGVHDDLSIPE